MASIGLGISLFFAFCFGATIGLFIGFDSGCLYMKTKRIYDNPEEVLKKKTAMQHRMDWEEHQRLAALEYENGMGVYLGPYDPVPGCVCDQCVGEVLSEA